ncbi:MAG TPA: 50S ribosomal protein L10 [Solirubrobacterales bacterium]|nr:50S ribosomal protein L10 [Solirubrobacterales bacterium]
MTKEDKAALVDEIADRLGDAEAIFAVDYRGITVPQAAELRSKLAEAEASFRVVKNRLAKRATERAGTTELDSLLQGPTALAFVKGDAVTAAKTISTFGRQHDILAYKGGLMDGAPLEPDQFTAIARLPGLDVLQGQLVGVVSSPLTGLTRGLASILSGLAVALGQIQEQGLVEGEEAPEQSELEPAGNEAEGEASGGDAVAEAASEPAAPSEPEPADAAPAEAGTEEAPDEGADEKPPDTEGQETSVEVTNDEEESSEESEAPAKDSEESDSEEDQ